MRRLPIRSGVLFALAVPASAKGGMVDRLWRFRQRLAHGLAMGAAQS
jgi:hypothetical protein